LRYQWRLEGADIPKATNVSLLLTNVQDRQRGNYSVLVLNPAGNALSADAFLDVQIDLSTRLPLVVTGSVWKYFDTGADLGTAWQQFAFDDSAWPSGRTQLGYGDGDEATVIHSNRTDNTRIITTYFRQSFPGASLDSTVTNLTLRLLRDDGAVVYLNESEVFRSNMTTGSINSTTHALLIVNGVGETTFFTTNLSPSLLRADTNLLAVELHQISTADTDASFDLGLDAVSSGAPLLLISFTDGQLLFSWLISLGYFHLETTGDLTASPTWVRVGPDPQISGGFYTVTLPPGPTTQFYRLARRSRIAAGE
jgi:hypothetical protein